MEILMSQCTNENNPNNYGPNAGNYLAKIFMHTICKLQREQPVHRFKAKTLNSLCTNETTQITTFSIYSKNVLTLKTTYTTSFS